MLLLLACHHPGEDPATVDRWPREGQVLDRVTVVTAEGARPDAALVFAGDTVWALTDAHQDWPERLEVVDGEGRWVLPGLIDSHVHMAYSGALVYPGERVAENLQAQLAWGVAGVVDVGGPTWTLALRDAVDEGRLQGPRMLATGPFLTAEGSHPCELAWDRRLCRFVGADPAADGQALLDEGADGLKVALAEVGIGTTWPRLDPAALEALVALGAPVFVHVGSAEDAQDAELASHLAHTPFASPLQRAPSVQSIHSTIGANAGILRTDDVPSTVPAEVAATWDPALYPEWAQAAEGWTRQARENLALLVAEQAPVVAGSDAGYYFVPHGYGLHLELEELVAAGMSPSQALAAATSVPAAIYGFEGLGCLEAGCEASFLVLDGDPLADIRNTRDIAWVVHRGEPLRPPGGGDDTFCLSDGDCPGDLRCDEPGHRCAAACDAWDPENACGEQAWCAPHPDGGGVCHAEVGPCDWRAQDCSAHYPETCVPLDADTSACWPAGSAALLQDCSSQACQPGLYCSPVSWTCLELCEKDQDCSWGSCHWEELDAGPWFGLCF